MADNTGLGLDFNPLLAALADPAQREALITKAAMNGPPPGYNQTPIVPGQPVQIPMAPSSNDVLDKAIQGGSATPASYTPEQVDAHKGMWSHLADTLADPSSPYNFMIRTGLSMMQPVPYGQSPAGAAAAALLSSADYLDKAKSSQKKEALANQLTQAVIGKTGAQTKNINATADSTSRKTQSADIQDELTKAEIALAYAKAHAANAKVKTPAEKVQLFNEVAQSLFETYPDKYKTLDEAKVALHQYDTTKGETPETKALVNAAPNMVTPGMTQSITSGVHTALKDQGGIPAGRTYQDSNRKVKPIESITPEQWIAVEKMSPADRAVLDGAYGKDKVDAKIAEAKKVLNGQ